MHKYHFLQKRWHLSLLIILAAFMLYGCEELIQCAIINWHYLPDKELKKATLNLQYAEKIEVGDKWDSFYHVFTVEDSKLPKGITYKTYNRAIIFDGYPKELGTFTFTINLDSSATVGDEDNETTCTETSYRIYTIVVEPLDSRQQ
jgi:hypothetical protein